MRGWLLMSNYCLISSLLCPKHSTNMQEMHLDDPFPYGLQRHSVLRVTYFVHTHAIKKKVTVVRVLESFLCVFYLVVHTLYSVYCTLNRHVGEA